MQVSGVIRKKQVGEAWETVLDTGNGGSSPILLKSTPVTSAELLDLKANPVELLPALTGRFYYDLQHLVLHYRFGTTPYVGKMDNFVIGYGVDRADLEADGKVFNLQIGDAPGFVVNDLLEQTADAYVTRGFLTDANKDYVGWTSSAIEGKPVLIANVDTDVIDGDGSLTVRLFYSLIDGAP